MYIFKKLYTSSEYDVSLSLHLWVHACLQGGNPTGSIANSLKNFSESQERLSWAFPVCHYCTPILLLSQPSVLYVTSLNLYIFPCSECDVSLSFCQVVFWALASLQRGIPSKSIAITLLFQGPWTLNDLQAKCKLEPKPFQHLFIILKSIIKWFDLRAFKIVQINVVSV